MLAFPRWHAGPTNAVLNDGEQRPVAQTLNGRVRQIGHLRVHVLTHLRTTVTIGSVAYRAVVFVMVCRRSPRGRIRVKRILLLLCVRWNRQAHESGGDRPFHGTRFRVGGQAASADPRVRDDPHDRDQDEERDHGVTEESHRGFLCLLVFIQSELPRPRPAELAGRVVQIAKSYRRKLAKRAPAARTAQLFRSSAEVFRIGNPSIHSSDSRVA